MFSPPGENKPLPRPRHLPVHLFPGLEPRPRHPRFPSPAMPEAARLLPARPALPKLSKPKREPRDGIGAGRGGRGGTGGSEPPPPPHNRSPSAGPGAAPQSWCRPLPKARAFPTLALHPYPKLSFRPSGSRPPQPVPLGSLTGRRGGGGRSGPSAGPAAEEEQSPELPSADPALQPDSSAAPSEGGAWPRARGRHRREAGTGRSPPPPRLAPAPGTGQRPAEPPPPPAAGGCRAAGRVSAVPGAPQLRGAASCGAEQANKQTEKAQKR